MTPRTVYTLDTLPAYVKELEAGEVCRVDDDLFCHFLEVLPPVYMSQFQIVEINGVKFKKLCKFGFCEGRDYVVDFWGSDGHYFAKRSNRINFGG